MFECQCKMVSLQSNPCLTMCFDSCGNTDKKDWIYFPTQVCLSLVSISGPRILNKRIKHNFIYSRSNYFPMFNSFVWWLWGSGYSYEQNSEIWLYIHFFVTLLPNLQARSNISIHLESVYKINICSYLSSFLKQRNPYSYLHYLHLILIIEGNIPITLPKTTLGWNFPLNVSPKAALPRLESHFTPKAWLESRPQGDTYHRSRHVPRGIHTQLWKSKKWVPQDMSDHLDQFPVLTGHHRQKKKGNPIRTCK